MKRNQQAPNAFYKRGSSPAERLPEACSVVQAPSSARNHKCSGFFRYKDREDITLLSAKVVLTRVVPPEIMAPMRLRIGALLIGIYVIQKANQFFGSIFSLKNH